MIGGQGADKGEQVGCDTPSDNATLNCVKFLQVGLNDYSR